MLGFCSKSRSDGWQDNEVICVNDGCANNSLEVLCGYGKDGITILIQ